MLTVILVSSQIKLLLENPNVVLQRKITSEGVLTDVQSGTEYIKLLQSGEFGDGDLSLIWNWDGIPVFYSSKY